jgi:large subunit ribosomal protein L25
MSETRELKAEVRDGLGKGAARAVRRQGKIPAVIYGDKKPPIPITLDAKELTMRLHAGGFLTHVLNLDVAGEQIRVIPKDFQLDPVKDTPVHVDFLRVSQGTLLTVDIPVHFQNHEAAPGIKRGGALNIVRHTVELLVPADNIPEEIVVDLTGLEIGDSIHISHVTLPAGAKPTITDRDFTIATIAGAGGASAEDEAAASAGEEGAA